MTCKEEIIKLMEDHKERTTYDIFKELSFSYGTVHRYVKELELINKISISKKEIFNENTMKIYYKITN